MTGQLATARDAAFDRIKALVPDGLSSAESKRLRHRDGPVPRVE
jgi:tartrate dehydratase beta subunit/fumarate hydratase class I family protein